MGRQAWLRQRSAASLPLSRCGGCVGRRRCDVRRRRWTALPPPTLVCAKRSCRVCVGPSASTSAATPPQKSRSASWPSCWRSRTAWTFRLIFPWRSRSGGLIPASPSNRGSCAASPTLDASFGGALTEPFVGYADLQLPFREPRLPLAGQGDLQ